MRTSPRTLPDAAVRARAATDLSTNLVILAGAGTGKTSLLVERALTALLTGHCSPGELAAITFTEKAAGEMLRRLAAALEMSRRLLAGAPAPADSGEAGRVLAALAPSGGFRPADARRRALAALEQLDRLRVTTIHAFCADLLRAWPRQAGVDPAFRVDTGEQTAALLEDAWNSFLAVELGPAAPRADRWRRLLEALPLGQIRQAAAALAGFRIPAFLLENPGAATTNSEIFGADVAALTAAMDRLREQRDKLTELHLATLQGLRDLLLALGADGLPGLRRSLEARPELAARIRKNSALKGGKKTGRELGAQLEQVDREARALVAALSRVDEDVVQDLLAALAPFALQVRETAQARGWLGFDALLALARDLLLQHPAVREAVKSRIRLLLVDEFQDTDPVQYDIVLLLAESPGQCSGDPYRTELAPGRLFIVGDPKQSIYRFRGADATAFQRTVARVAAAGGAILDLTANFRSRPEVIAPINALFTAGPAWQEGPYQPPYVPIHPVREPAGEARVELWTVDPGPEPGAGARRRAEAEVLAREIAARARDGRGDGSEPSMRFGDVTILLRAFTNLSPLLRSLRRHGIPFLVDGGREFLARPEVEHLLALLRTLARPDDPVALLAFLRSPGGGVPDTELAAFAASRQPWSWRQADRVDETRSPRLAAALDELRRLDATLRELPVSGQVRRVLRESALLTVEAAAFEGPQRVANLAQLADAAATLARDGSLSLRQVLDAIAADIRPASVEADSPLADEDTDAVKVLTIHKAKGLDNRVIIVPDLARQEAGARSPAIAVDPVRLPAGRDALAVRCHQVRSAVSVWHEREQERHEKAEEQRILYVALTRARERLILLAGPARTSTPWLETLRAWGYDPEQPPAEKTSLAGGCVRHDTLRPTPTAPPSTGPPPPVPEAFVQAYRAAAERARELAPAAWQRPSGVSGEWAARMEDAGAGPGPGGGPLAAAPSADAGPAPGGVPAAGGSASCLATARGVGILVHRVLERWRGAHGAHLREHVHGLAAAVAAETGDDPARLATASLQVISSFLDSPLARRWRTLAPLARELPVLLQAADGSCWRGSIDLLYRGTGGDPVVADFKTDAEADLDLLTARHGAQLAVYAEAVRRAFRLPHPPRAELWMLRHGRIVALDVAPQIRRLKLSPPED